MSITESTSRREFLKLFTFTSACGALMKADWHGTVLAEVRPLSQGGNGKVRLNLADFPTLAQDFGSVRVGTSGIANNRPRGLLYPILINRGTGNQFYAMSAECTHEGCVVSAFSRTGNASTCPCHSSRFAIDGSRISGVANFPLQSYPIDFDQASNSLTIELPDFIHEINSVAVQPGGSRLQLKFFGLRSMVFEVLFRESLTAAWKPVSFSTTPDGPLTLTTVTGADRTVDAYVEKPQAAGFYSISIRVTRM